LAVGNRGAVFSISEGIVKRLYLQQGAPTEKRTRSQKTQISSRLIDLAGLTDTLIGDGDGL
jgi:hypothetical protein